MLKYAWAIPLVPLIAFIVILLSGKRMNNKGFFVSIGGAGLSLLLSILTFFEVANGKSIEINKTWLLLGRMNLDVGILVDSLAAVMLLVVTSVALLVQIYSVGYMHGEKRYDWYFAAISLFTAAMLSVVLANNYLQMYMSWEVMGLCSYLLIGFWFEKKSASDAAKKAFIVTRIGDVGFFLGIAALIVFAGSVNFTSLSKIIEAGKLGAPLLAAVGILLFAGAMGKSAQFPLHVWLPDAMEGPTPVSALIHAATMVAAGVYLVARSFFIFEAALPSAFTVVAVIGTITALMAATIALTMSDIKKILAYSTISRLGFMMVALGVGGYVAGVFHLMTHAFFKALLFLGAGSVIHGTGTQNIYDMGGLSKKMKITFITFLVASLSIAGIFPLSGFWSKDEILADAFKGGHYLIFGILLFTAFLTAFYMFRLVFLVFFGRPRNDNIHAHESPPSMTYPLIILAIPAALAGLLGSPFLGSVFVSFLEGGHAEVHLNYLLMGASLLVGLLGIGTAWAVYYKGWLSEEKIKKRFSPLYHVLENKYYFDEIYHNVFVRPVVGLAALLNRFDLQIIDGVIKGAAITALRASGVVAIFDKRAIDDAINALGGATVKVSAGTSVFDQRVIDGVVNALGGATVKVSAETSVFDQRAIDGVVNAIGGATVATSAETSVVEHKVIDRFVNGIGKTVQWLSRRLRVIHTGNILNYAVYIFIAELVAIMIALAIAWLSR